MKNVYHILNGDSLKIQFPNSIFGNKIIARLCLVDGNVNGESLTKLFKIRAKFISNTYSFYTEQDYYNKTVTEIKKINIIPKNAEINLWFEDDLFCQVNFWFILNLIHTNNISENIYIVRPKKNCEYNFGNMSKEELVKAYKRKIKFELSEINELSKLWKLYQQNKLDKMLDIANQLKKRYPFLNPAIKAHIDRIPKNRNLGRPKQTLIKIIKDLKTDNFEQVFNEFCKRESIYGFGDLQVKRMFDEIIKNY
jgi:hypothetical protein